MRRWSTPTALAIGRRVDTKVPPVSTYLHPQIHSISLYLERSYWSLMEIEKKKVQRSFTRKWEIK
jgi:hypothetical protein